MRAPLLTSVDHTNLTISDSTSILPIAQYTSSVLGSITVSGANNTRTFTNLTDVDGASFNASAAATLNLPGVASYTYTGGFETSAAWQADGAGFFDAGGALLVQES